MIAEFLTGAGTTILGSILTWCAAAVTSRRADVKAARAVTRAQADELIVAVTELRGIAQANMVLWGRWIERGRTLLLTLAAGFGGYARTAVIAPESKTVRELARAAGAGAAADMLGRDRREAKRADAAVLPAMTRVWAAAAPLLRHPDRHVGAATEQLLAAVTNIEATKELDIALREFGRAVVPVTTVPPPRWQQLRIGSGLAAVDGAGDTPEP